MSDARQAAERLKEHDFGEYLIPVPGVPQEYWSSRGDIATLVEAAAELALLRAENERLTARVELLSQTVSSHVDEIRECDALVTELAETLRAVQWVTMGGYKQSAYPTCVGCGAKQYGSVSRVSHAADCRIEAVLRKVGQ